MHSSVLSAIYVISVHIQLLDGTMQDNHFSARVQDAGDSEGNID